jgi:hypothetical protein
MVRNEVDRMLLSLQHNLSQHSSQLNTALTTKLAEYFDPKSGRFEDRIRRLLERDGELSAVLNSQLSSMTADMTKQMQPLLGLLDPHNANGVAASIEKVVAQQMQASHQHLVSEFSLDNKASSLSRLVAELHAASKSNSDNTDAAVKGLLRQFSLDDPASALSRLVGTVTASSQALQAQFTLDDERSALSRLRREVGEVVQAQGESIQRLEQTMVRELAALNAQKKTQKELEKASTLHGHTFEAAVVETVKAILGSEGGSAGAMVEAVGGRTGAIRNCKVGDVLVEMGEEHIAAGARIVLEAKDDKSYTLSKVLDELDVARRNRGADVGVFVYRAGSVAGLEGLRREGNSILCALDCEDAQHGDVFLRAGLSLARALLVRKAQSSGATSVDVGKVLDVVEKQVREVEKEAENVAEMKKLVETVASSAEKMSNRIRISSGRLVASAATLDEALGKLRQRNM